MAGIALITLVITGLPSIGNAQYSTVQPKELQDGYTVRDKNGNYEGQIRKKDFTDGYTVYDKHGNWKGDLTKRDFTGGYNYRPRR